MYWFSDDKNKMSPIVVELTPTSFNRIGDTTRMLSSNYVEAGLKADKDYYMAGFMVYDNAGYSTKLLSNTYDDNAYSVSVKRTLTESKVTVDIVTSLSEVGIGQRTIKVILNELP